MSSPPDPIRRLRRISGAVWLIGALAVVGCGAWAVRIPRAAPTPVVDLAAPRPATDNDERARVDPAAFQARLWNPPPRRDQQRPSEVAGKPRRRPLNLQLIGITREDGKLYAAVYEPKTDRLHVLKDGDRVADHTVTRVDPDGVEFSDGRSTQRLALKQPGRSPS